MSNKTPKNNDAKTASVPKNKKSITRWLIVLGVCAVIGSATLLFGATQLFSFCRDQNLCLRLEIAQTPAARQRGLSGRDSLPQNQGMLFKFEEPGFHCFWMKDMKFPVDMVWLDSRKQIVHVEKSADPKDYPHRFCPDQASQYVIEVNAGVAQRYGWQEQKRLTF